MPSIATARSSLRPAALILLFATWGTVASADPAAAEKAMNDAKAAVELAAKQLADLRAKLPEITKTCEAAKVEAERAAAAAEKELAAAKADAEKRRADYDAAKAGIAKL